MVRQEPHPALGFLELGHPPHRVVFDPAVLLLGDRQGMGEGGVVSVDGRRAHWTVITLTLHQLVACLDDPVRCQL